MKRKKAIARKNAIWRIPPTVATHGLEREHDDDERRSARRSRSPARAAGSRPRACSHDPVMKARTASAPATSVVHRKPEKPLRPTSRRVEPRDEDEPERECAVGVVELLRRAAPVGEEQQPDRRLSDQERLREDERVRHERASGSRPTVRDERRSARIQSRPTMTTTPSAMCTVTIARTLLGRVARSTRDLRRRGRRRCCRRAGLPARRHATVVFGPSIAGTDPCNRTADAEALTAVNAAGLGYDRRVVEEGKPAPSFTLTSDSGQDVSLESFRGKPVVLYFYPKDDTPGCTAQACGIRDVWGEFERKGAVVLGVSPDSPKKHVKFRAEVRASVHAPLGREPRGSRELRHVGREEHVRQDVHGHGALDVRDRRRRERRRRSCAR